MIRFGPAGWSYKDWAGVVYPKPAGKGFDQLRYLSGFFDTIEVNSTYYRPASRKTAVSWLDRVDHNERFRFTAKIWQRFTHQRKEAWSRDDVEQVREAFDPLHDGGRLGAVLLQFPWSFRRVDENLEWLRDLTSEFVDYPLVLEVRHESWNVPEFYRELREVGTGFVNIDQPQFSSSIGPSARATAGIGYIRVHGRNYQDWWRKDAAPHERYDYLYRADELEPWAERAKELAAEPTTADVYVVTNNHFRGKSVTNALMLQSMVTGKNPEGPPPLFGVYGEMLDGYAVPGGAGTVNPGGDPRPRLDRFLYSPTVRHDSPSPRSAIPDVRRLPTVERGDRRRPPSPGSPSRAGPAPSAHRSHRPRSARARRSAGVDLPSQNASRRRRDSLTRRSSSGGIRRGRGSGRRSQR
jgi:uncharacterized protein YecE (DUF72 family)